MKKRELEDYKLKSMSQLNIHVPKFSGLDHKVDIYSFQTKFEEEHARLPKAKCLYQLKEKYLIGAAKEMVKLKEDIADVWTALKEAFGDPVLLLNNELECVRKLGPLAKIRDHQELAVALSRLANAMENLSKTARIHKIEYELYNTHSEGMLYEIIGDQRVERFLEKMEAVQSLAAAPLSKAEEWDKLRDFLREESKRRSKMALRLKPPTSKLGSKKEVDEKKKMYQNSLYTDDSQDNTYDRNMCHQGNTVESCKACGGSSCENKGDRGFEYVKCKKFRAMAPGDRLKKLKKDKVCFQCLQTSHDIKKDCPNNEFSCKHDFHKKFNKGFHVLVCQDHQDDKENKRLLEEYKLN